MANCGCGGGCGCGPKCRCPDCRRTWGGASGLSGTNWAVRAGQYNATSSTRNNWKLSPDSRFTGPSDPELAKVVSDFQFKLLKFPIKDSDGKIGPATLRGMVEWVKNNPGPYAPGSTQSLVCDIGFGSARACQIAVAKADTDGGFDFTKGQDAAEWNSYMNTGGRSPAPTSHTSTRGGNTTADAIIAASRAATDISNMGPRMMSETIQAAARYAQKPKEKDNTAMYVGVSAAAALGLILLLRRRA